MRYKYTNDDIEFLRNYYPKGDWDKIHERFPMLSDSSIHHKCNRLGINFNSQYKVKFDSSIKRKSWTNEELDVLKKYYSTVPMNKLLLLLPDRNKNMITNAARRLNLLSYNHITLSWREDEIKYIIDNWKTKPDKIIAKELGRSFRAVKEKRRSLNLYRQDMESNSYPTLAKYLRGQNQKWKLESMEKSNYRCVLTGSKDFEIHHLYGVSNIISDILNRYEDYKDKPFDDYSEKDLSFILEKFLKEQDKYPLGECIYKKLHVLFHSLYGQYYNTPEQWEQFKKDYKEGIYKNIT